MYVKLKEELRTIEFIKKYFSKIYITKPEMVHSYESNHFMLNLRPIIKLKGLKEEVIHLEDGELLSSIFLDKNTENYKLIIHSLTWSSANVSNLFNNYIERIWLWNLWISWRCYHCTLSQIWSCIIQQKQIRRWSWLNKASEWIKQILLWN